MNLGVAPHELGVWGTGALLVESEEFFILRQGDLVVFAAIVLFGNLELIAFDLPHLFKDGERNLLEV